MQRKSRLCQRMLPVLLLFAMMQVVGQGADTGKKAPATWEHDHKHLLGLGFGFSFIPTGNALGDNDARGLFAPTVGLDYFYRINRRWGAGFLGALELDHYVVTDDQVERENALNMTLVGMFSASKHLDFFLGGGVEVEQHDNLGVFRLGTQYSIDVGKHWALVPKLHFDIKGNYNTWNLAMSFARKL